MKKTIDIEGSRTVTLEKYQLLNKTRETLKKEFIGIDLVIDKVIDSLSAWFLFPEMQERPMIINLWGMTGVGKSSLVDRISTLLDFEDRYFHFDLSDSESREYAIKSKLESINEEKNGYPIVVAFDEFQHARSLDSNREELSNRGKIVWTILDSGKFQTSRSNFRIEKLVHTAQRLGVYSQHKVNY